MPTLTIDLIGLHETHRESQHIISRTKDSSVDLKCLIEQSRRTIAESQTLLKSAYDQLRDSPHSLRSTKT